MSDELTPRQRDVLRVYWSSALALSCVSSELCGHTDWSVLEVGLRSVGLFDQADIARGIGETGFSARLAVTVFVHRVGADLRTRGQ